MQAPGGDTAFLGLCCELAGGRANPVRDVLPPLIHLPATDGATAGWLEPTVRLLAMESVSHTPGRSIVLNRLAEVVFVQLIRVWIDRLPAGEGGWLRALKDAQLASAMQAMHTAPGEAWTLESLAERASMSRSAFAARFKAVVGETPLDYLTRWRIQRAMSLLEQGNVPLKEIVSRSGYASEAAFRTVFKSRVGESPGSYRTRVRGD